jgi:hypothetical protein
VNIRTGRFLLEKEPPYSLIAGWVAPRAVGLDVLKNRKSLAPAGIRTHGGGLLLRRRTQYVHH